MKYVIDMLGLKVVFTGLEFIEVVVLGYQSFQFTAFLVGLVGECRTIQVIVII